jgi:hypothetical protein
MAISSVGFSEQVAAYIRSQHVNSRNQSAVLNCCQRIETEFGEQVSPEDVVDFLEGQPEEKGNGVSGRGNTKFVNHQRHRVCACRSGRTSGRR